MVVLIGHAACVEGRAHRGKVRLRARSSESQMRGNCAMMGWSAGTLQSSTRRGLVSARRRQSSHMVPATGSSAARRSALYRERSSADPTELILSFQAEIPNSLRKVASISSTSASRSGDSLPALGGPMTSAPI